MKVLLFQEKDLDEDYAEIHCAQETEEIREVARWLGASSQTLLGKGEEGLEKISVANVFYFESVDKKTFACLKDRVCEVELTLRELETKFGVLGFVRINKSTVVNIYRIEKIQNDFEMRMLLCLENGELLVLNRSYKKEFKQCLERIKKKLQGGAYEADR